MTIENATEAATEAVMLAISTVRGVHREAIRCEDALVTDDDASLKDVVQIAELAVRDMRKQLSGSHLTRAGVLAGLLSPAMLHDPNADSTHPLTVGRMIAVLARQAQKAPGASVRSSLG